MEGGEEGLGGADAGEAGEDGGVGEGVGFGGEGGGGVLGEEGGEAEAGGGAGGGFDAEVGGDAGDHDGGDVAGPELGFEVGAEEGAPLALGDEEIGGLVAGFGDEFGGIGKRRRVGGLAHGGIDGELEHVGEIDADVNDEGAFGAEGVGEGDAALDDVLGGVGGELAGGDGVLEVDEDEGGGARVEVEGVGRHGDLPAGVGTV